MLFAEPLVVQFYEIITELESDKLQQLATPRLKVATIRDPETGQLRNADYRVQKTTWLALGLTSLIINQVQKDK